MDSLEPSSLNGTAADKKTGRCKTKCHYLNKLQASCKIEVDFDLGQAMGDNANLLASYCGTLARDNGLLPIDKKSWDKVDDESKTRVWEAILKKFDIDADMREYIMQSVRKQWRDHKCHLKATCFDKFANNENEFPECPSSIHKEQWQNLWKENK